MKAYRVLCPLTHDKIDYVEGGTVHLEERIAAALKRARVVQDIPADQDTCVSEAEGGADSAPPEVADDRSVRRARRSAA